MRKKLRVIILFISFIAFAKGTKIYAQQDPSYSQYMFNIFLINPAAAGSDGTTTVNFTGREQWLGWEGTPRTHSISAQTRVLKNSFIAKALNLRKKFNRRSSSGNIGIGAQIFNDISGPIVRTGLQIDYGYHIPIRRNQLSFGLALQPYQFNVIKSQLRNYEQDDQIINNIRPRYIIDGNFGMLYTTPLWLAGLSVTNLFQSNIAFGGESKVGYKILRHYCINGSYKIEVNRQVLIEPTTLIKFTEQGTFQMDLSARAFYKEDYWGGLSYRTGAGGGAMIFLAGLRVRQYYFGYSFDWTFSPVMSHTLGTHEFMFFVKFGENARRYRWLNRY
jgi:type IX secretion system PorP/SprF family membrane protein